MTTSASQESQPLPDDVLSSDGVPFKTKGAASMVCSNKGMTGTHNVIQIGNAFVLRPVSAYDKEKKIKGSEDEQVFWVRIRPASGNVKTNARLSLPGVNGEILYLRRGRRYPIPARFLTVMDSTLHPVSRHVIGNDRQDTMWEQDDNYDVEGPATQDDYKKWAAESDHGRNEIS